MPSGNDAVLNSTAADSGEGVPYQIEYGLRVSTSSPILWIDECGRWFAGADGRPSRAQGIIRINNERHARDEQLLKLSQDDPLTGEFNRARLIAALAEAIEEAGPIPLILRFHAGWHRSPCTDQRCLRL